MSTWQHIWMLIRFDLKHSRRHLLLLLLLYPLLMYLFISTIPISIEENRNYFLLDCIFFLHISIITIRVRPKIFQLNKIGKQQRASHFLIHLQHLPIKKNQLIAYSMLTYYIISLPLYIIFLAALYITSPTIQQLMPIGTYSVFSLLWLFINIFVLSTLTVSDIGISFVRHILFTITFSILYIVIFLTGLYGIYDTSFVHITIELAKNYPMWTIFLSLFLTSIGVYSCIKSCQHKLKTIDYLS